MRKVESEGARHENVRIYAGSSKLYRSGEASDKDLNYYSTLTMVPVRIDPQGQQKNGSTFKIGNISSDNDKEYPGIPLDPRMLEPDDSRKVSSIELVFGGNSLHSSTASTSRVDISRCFTNTGIRSFAGLEGQS